MSKGESIDQYATELRTLASTCEFQDLRDGLVRDRIVGGIRNAALRECLIRIADLSLEKALDICRAAEQSNRHLKFFRVSPQAMLTKCVPSTHHVTTKLEIATRKRSQLKNNKLVGAVALSMGQELVLRSGKNAILGLKLAISQNVAIQARKPKIQESTRWTASIIKAAIQIMGSIRLQLTL